MIEVLFEAFCIQHKIKEFAHTSKYLALNKLQTFLNQSLSLFFVFLTANSFIILVSLYKQAGTILFKAPTSSFDKKGKDRLRQTNNSTYKNTNSKHTFNLKKATKHTHTLTHTYAENK